MKNGNKRELGRYPYPDPLPRVAVEWLDSVVLSYGWAEPEHYARAASTEGGMEHNTVGYLMHVDEDKIILVLNYSKARGHVCQAVVIPKVAVLSIEDI